MANEALLIVIGSGPGIGLATAKLFSQHGFGRVCLLSRNEERLQGEKNEVLEASQNQATVTTHAVDISALEALKRTFEDVQRQGRLECVFFNAARVAMSTVLETPTEEIEEDFKTTNLALYETAKWAIPLLQANKDKCSTAEGPSLLVTNSLLWKEPLPFVFSLSMVKAAQRALMLSLHDKFGKEVHCAMVSVEGQVSPDDPIFSPKLIAEKFLKLHTQKKGEWQRDLEMTQKSG